MVETLSVSQRRACRAIGQPRSSQRYVARRRNGERALTDRMGELALRHPRYGYRRITALLRRDGWRVNRKRVHRLWRREGLKVVQKQRKKPRLIDGSRDNACHRRRAERANHVWSVDFVHDRTAGGGPLKILSVIDEYTRECLAIEARRHVTGADVIALLKALMGLHGVPGHVRCDNGPEFIGRAIRRGLAESGVSTLYVAPASPWENGYVESYHARLRDELLDREQFGSVYEARALLEAWREQYNQERPHSALGYLAPAAFAAACGRADPCSATLRKARHDEEDVLASVAQ